MILVALASVVAAGGWALHRGPGGDGDGLGLGLAGGVPPVVVASTIASGAATEAPPPAATTAVSAPHAHPAVTVRYTFDGGITGQVMDGGGRLPLRVRKAGGELSTLPHGAGGRHPIREPDSDPPESPGHAES